MLDAEPIGWNVLTELERALICLNYWRNMRSTVAFGASMRPNYWIINFNCFENVVGEKSSVTRLSIFPLNRFQSVRSL